MEDEHDVEAIIQIANDKLAQNDLSGAQKDFQSALLTWDDEAREMDGDDPDLPELVERITTLWIEYAKLNVRAKQFKVATQTFEAAINCPIAGSKGRLWGEYAKLQLDRERLISAQKIYLRALIGDDTNEGLVTDENEKSALWEEFLIMMRKAKKNDNLTLDELKSAVAKEVVPPPVKKTKLDHVKEAPTAPTIDDLYNFQAPASAPAAPIPATVAVTPQTVEAFSTELIPTIQSIPPHIKSEWIARDGDTLSTDRPELFTPSPPKLGDASGKDILGTEIALKLIRLLLKNSEIDVTGMTILDIARGCWMMNLIKQKEAAKGLSLLEESLTNEMEELEKKFTERGLVNDQSLSAALEQMNATEMNALLNSCNQLRQKYLSDKCWEFRALLAAQQQLLTSASFPEFNGPTTDTNDIHVQKRICSFLHSAFYLRAKVGEKDHLSMLKSQETKLSKMDPVPMPGMPVQKPPVASHLGLPPPVNYMPGLPQYPPPAGYPIPGQQPLHQNIYMQQPFNAQVHQPYR